MLDETLASVKKFIPKPIFNFFQPYYHWCLAYLAAAIYGFPSRKLKIVGVTGTNGKSTVVHLLTSILEEAGEKAASISSLRFRINKKEETNTLKMTMPGRFKLQKFLREAVKAGCKYGIIEITSEGIKQHRHIGIDFYMAVLTNVTPEHIESHGTFEKYRAAKAELFKKAKIHVLNGEDPSIDYFLKIPASPAGRPAQNRIIYSKKDFPPNIHLKLLGDFNLENSVAAYHAAKLLGIEFGAIKSALEKTEGVPGRLEFIQKEPFSVVVDYAHTPDALEKIYETLRPPGKTLGVFGDSTPSVEEGRRLICVLGSAGGGRDKWKRPEMGKIAAKFCDEIILTNEDPYDENPEAILAEVERGIAQKNKLRKILDRKEAIGAALKSAEPGDTVIITGKGAEPWLMGPNGSKIPWDDREVAREELASAQK
ncbi:MAG: UDP-N-acetylmuramoyl-L-alanyl-D-glutamate--2,6-diaminopimelate ligase [Candidatus Giovannonibacteria bacterium]|nr:UDP-N-acetylmuramoyl-L-alanyl-D-glutamate--2,6-diaminopimelate ligase [Candidatus Giovannonibacteria bacterium]